MNSDNLDMGPNSLDWSFSHVDKNIKPAPTESSLLEKLDEMHL